MPVCRLAFRGASGCHIFIISSNQLPSALLRIE
jgi:hypothetical protein